MNLVTNVIALRTVQPVLISSLRVTAKLLLSALLALIIAFMTAVFAPALAASEAKVAGLRFVTPGEMKSGGSG